MPEPKARAIGINHVALEVGDIEEALAFYGRLFDFTLRGKDGNSAFIDLGDQFLALQKGGGSPPMTAATSAWWSTTRKKCARRSSRQGSSRCREAFSTSAIPGATASRSSAMTTSSSPRPRMCSAA